MAGKSPWYKLPIGYHQGPENDWMRVRPHLPRTKPQAEHWTEKDGTDNVICDHSIQQHMYAYVNINTYIIIIDIYIIYYNLDMYDLY